MIDWLKILQNEIADDVRRCRKERGMTQAELARKAGLGDRTVWMVERGATNAELGTLVAIAKALGKNVMAGLV